MLKLATLLIVSLGFCFAESSISTLPVAPVQPETSETKKPGWLKDNWRLMVLYGGSVADYVTTRQALSRPNTHEANPLYSSNGKFSDARYWALNLPLNVGLTWAYKKNPHNPMIRTVIPVLGFVKFGVAFGVNARAGR